MRPNKIRFVTACQQFLVLGAVIAVLTPAANVISLDMTTQPPAPSTGAAASGLTESDLASAEQAGEPEAAEVETAPVAPVVEEFAIDEQTTEEALQEAPGLADELAEDPAPEGTEELRRAPGGSSVEALSKTEDVQGYAAVGVTWDDSESLEEDEISVLVRTRTGDDEWTEWTALEYHDEHGPDPDSAEGRKARPGTDPLLVGEVDQVQARAVTADGVELPTDLKLAVIAPGQSEDTAIEEPALDTSELETQAPTPNPGDGATDGVTQEPTEQPSQQPSQEPTAETGEAPTDSSTGTSPEGSTDGPTGAATPGAESSTTLPSDQGEIALQATKVTAKPQIYSRAQWGANENLRDASSLSYYEVHAGFVHHTVNSNSYTRDEVPGIIRSIYAYHTQSRGWSDIGYNFLVDKFGRIWEGRFGGVDRPVVGAHTLGYNEYSFAMSAIGNYDKTRPSSAMIEAYGRLFAWKLSLHGVNANSSRQPVGSGTFPAVNGHRDAGQTACPGRYLYDQIGAIRSKAAAYQVDWDGRELVTDLVGSEHPDFLVRRDDGTGFVIPTEGGSGASGLGERDPISNGWGGYDKVLMTPDVTGDGIDDVVVRSASSGSFAIRPGRGTGWFGAHVEISTALRGMDQITAVGNLNGYGRADLVARDPRTGRLMLLRGASEPGTFAAPIVLSRNWGGYTMTAATGDTNGDAIPDVYSRDRNGNLLFHAGAGGNALKAPVRVMGNMNRFDIIAGYGDMTGDGKADLAVRVRASENAYVYPGLGDGRFDGPVGPLVKASYMQDFTFGDLDANGRPDLVTHRKNSMIGYYYQDGGGLGTPVSVGKLFADATMLLNVGDWDRDGHGDIIKRVENGGLWLIRGLGNNRFADAVSIGGAFRYYDLITAPGDVTGDGYPDLMAQPPGGAMRIYPGNGSRFKSSFRAHSEIRGSAQVGVGRWDSDGAPDNLIRDGSSGRLYRGNGPGGLTGGTSLSMPSLSGYDWVLSAGDIDGDGRQDLIVRKASTGVLYLMPGTSSGFGAAQLLANGFGRYNLAG